MSIATTTTATSTTTSSVSRLMSRRVRIATGLVCATVAAVALSAGGANADGGPEDPHGDLTELTATDLGLSEGPAPMARAAASGDDRPDFQMPFKCGETWQGASRAHHSPTANAVDWTQGGSTVNSPVVASADGVAKVTDLGNRSYGKFVVINHGGGWSTVYAHLNGFNISNGASVKAGQQIGIVGSTGNSSGAHLHYEQRYSMDDQRTVFNGSPFGGSGTWSKSLTSKNCETKTPDPKPEGPGDPAPGTTGMADLASADLNGDHVVDVVAVEASTGKLWLYKGASSGSIASGGNRVLLGSGGWNGMTNLTGGDFTGDGKDDIVAVEESTGKLWLYKGADNSTIASGGSRMLIGSGGWNGMSNLTALNLNGDATADLAGVEKSSGKLYLYPGAAGGQIGARKEIGSGGWNGMSNLTGMDLNNSGRQDLVAVEKSSGKLFMYPGDKGYLSPRIEIGSGGWNGMSDLIGGDLLNSNLSDDLIAVQNSTGKLFLYPGTGQGGLGARKEIGTGGW
ncbi:MULTISPECIES: peptidoglycan DD-metalloendopeptidase family protein [unclassified Streptomyces]|uniref:peptidoglycan DD-metalloendopeptidase family protein n=1 Tax=unclassified Streptomyces TaxID=2593676 RepID=UPI00382DE3B5